SKSLRHSRLSVSFAAISAATASLTSPGHLQPSPLSKREGENSKAAMAVAKKEAPVLLVRDRGNDSEQHRGVGGTFNARHYNRMQSPAMLELRECFARKELSMRIRDFVIKKSNRNEANFTFELQLDYLLLIWRDRCAAFIVRRMKVAPTFRSRSIEH